MYVLALIAFQICSFSLVERWSYGFFFFFLSSLGPNVYSFLHGHTKSAGSYCAFRNEQSKLWIETQVQASSSRTGFGHSLQSWPSLITSWPSLQHPYSEVSYGLLEYFSRIFTQCPAVISLLTSFVYPPKHYNKHVLIVYYLWVVLFELCCFYSLTERDGTMTDSVQLGCSSVSCWVAYVPW